MPNLPSFDEILREINKLDNEKIDGFTTRDLITNTGRPEKWCLQKIRELINKGSLEFAGKVCIESIDNRRVKVPAYRLVKK